MSGIKDEDTNGSFLDRLSANSVSEIDGYEESGGIADETVAFVDDVVDDSQESGSDNIQEDSAQDGKLPAEARKALVYLYRQGSILLTRNKDRYDILCAYENQVREHLKEVYLNVIFDKKSGHIFTEVSGDSDDEDFAPLITTKPLSLYQSILLVVIRKYYQDRETAGEQVIVVDEDRLKSLLVPYLEISHSSKKDRDRLNRAINSLSDKKLLLSLRGDEGRYQISPIIRNVVNADLLENLLEEYKRMLGVEDSSKGTDSHE